MNIKPADHAVRLKAIDLTKSILLQAPAGSGKTGLLTQRFLNLLSVVAQPEQIVALTFTNKAATEMRERVIAQLEKASSDQPISAEDEHEKLNLTLAQKALAHSKQQQWHLLNNPNRLRIMTFDSLALSIVQRMPVLAKNRGIDQPDPANIGQMLKNAARNTIDAVNAHDDYAAALEIVLEQLENDSFQLEKMLVDILAKRDQWLRLGLGADHHLKHELEENWQQLVWPLVAELCDLFTTEDQYNLKFFYDYSCQQDSVQLGSDYQQNLTSIKNWAQMIFKDDGTLRKTVNKNHGFPVGTAQEKQLKKDFLAFLSAISEKTALINLWQQVIKLPIPEYSDDKWRFITALFKVLQLTVINLKLEFTRQGKVDFSEITQAALMALGTEDNPSDLALYLDHRISHLLVDEFQDTNHSQFALIEKISMGWNAAEGQTMFLVGDPMQSIYRFREADVGLFLRAKQQGIGELEFDFLQLEVNFRSRPAVVAWVNDNFKTIFPAKDDLLSGAVSYAPSIAYKPKDNDTVQFHGFLSEEQIAETAKIVEIIQDTLKTHPTGHKIAILLRSRAHFADIAVALAHNDIAYKAVDMDLLSNSQLIEDLRNLSRGFTHFGDRAAWLAILRAPWCGLTLCDLQAMHDAGPDTTIWQLINDEDVLARLSADGQIRARHLSRIFNTAYLRLAQFDTAQIIEKLWHELGGEKIFTRPQDILAAEMFFNCLQVALRPWGLDAKQLDEAIAKLYAPTASDASVECMTIHKAKGLEFDTVILPLLHKPGRHDDKQLIQWSENLIGESSQATLLLAPVKLPSVDKEEMYDYLANLAKQKAYFEEMRVFYVAATRAKQCLYLLATLRPNANKARANSLLNLIYVQVADDFSEADDGSVTAQNVDTEVKLRRRQSAALGYDYTPAKPTGNIVSKLFIPENAQTTAGIIFHQICEQAARFGLDKINQARLADIIKIKLSFSTLEEQQNLQEKILSGFNNMLNDKTGRWILQNSHLASAQEWKIAHTRRGKINYAIIDRSFIDNDIRWIIDYKFTAPHDNEEIEGFLTRMAQEYQPQLKGYAQLVAQLDHRKIKLMLYLPLIDCYSADPFLTFDF